MPLSSDLKERLAGNPHDVTPESEDLRKVAKWHAERVGGLKNAKLKSVGKNIYHAELEERSHPGHSEREYHHDGDTDEESGHFAFR